MMISCWDDLVIRTDDFILGLLCVSSNFMTRTETNYNEIPVDNV